MTAPGFQHQNWSEELSGCNRLGKLEGACSEDDRKTLEEALEHFCCKKKDASASEHGKKVGIRPDMEAEMAGVRCCRAQDSNTLH